MGEVYEATGRWYSNELENRYSVRLQGNTVLQKRNTEKLQSADADPLGGPSRWID